MINNYLISLYFAATWVSKIIKMMDDAATISDSWLASNSNDWNSLDGGNAAA